METVVHEESERAAAETWTAITQTRGTLAGLWQVLFSTLAAEAGLPAPMSVHDGLASYAEKRHADALASHVKARLGQVPTCFRVGSKATGTRHCVSLS